MFAFYTFLIPPTAASDDADLALLLSGKVVIEDSQLSSTGGSVRARVLIRAPVETIWQVITTCEYAFRYLTGMEDCEVTVSEPERALTHHVVDPGWFAPEMDYWFETRRHPYSRMDIELTSGNMKEMKGYWQFDPVDDAILVEHQISIRPSVPAPRWLVQRKLETDLPDMLACIRGLAGGSLSGEIEKSDLAACQPAPKKTQ